jgi:hypothetical protein
VSAGSRIAARYRGHDSRTLRNIRHNIRNPRCIAAIDIVLTERQDAYQKAFDAGQVLLDVLGGQEATAMHAKTLDVAMRARDVQDWLAVEKAMGMADALWDYLQERSDT